jgi:two-component system response regulator AtoC
MSVGTEAAWLRASMSAYRILIIEDELVLAQNLESFLRRRSPDVRVAVDGEHALEMLASFAPDVAVIDYGLPGMNGLQIYNEIVRRRTSPIGCVIITAYPLESIACAANEQGIRHLLRKPFNLSELQHHVDWSADEALHASRFRLN